VTAPATLGIEATATSVTPAALTRRFSMPARPWHFSHSTFGRCLGLVIALLGAAMRTADAQRAGGSIGVSLTILESVETRAARITSFRFERDGHATIETTAASAGRVSRIVMARMANSAGGFQPVGQVPVLLPGDGGGAEPMTSGAGSQRITHRVDVGRASPGSIARDVRLRIEYLVVAGT